MLPCGLKLVIFAHTRFIQEDNIEYLDLKVNLKVKLFFILTFNVGFGKNIKHKWRRTMPYTVRKTKSGYRVSGPGGVHMKHGTKSNMQKQLRLLRAIDNGFKPRK